jgi:hypothetical protein
MRQFAVKKQICAELAMPLPPLNVSGVANMCHSGVAMSATVQRQDRYRAPLSSTAKVCSSGTAKASSTTSAHSGVMATFS